MQTALAGADRTMEILESDFADEELTVRRDPVASPRRGPARLAVEIGDSEATWKWSAPRSDGAGRHIGLDLPALDGPNALEWSRDDVAPTTETCAPLAMPPASEVIALLKPKRRPLPVRPVESTAQLMAMIAPPKRFRFVAPIALVLSALIVSWGVTRLLQRSQAIIGETGGLRAPKLLVPLPDRGAPTTGTLLTTLEGKGHRVFVDGKPAFEGGQSFVIACGKHVVRVGNGKPREVDVPCGDELAVSP